MITEESPAPPPGNAPPPGKAPWAGKSLRMITSECDPALSDKKNINFVQKSRFLSLTFRKFIQRGCSEMLTPFSLILTSGPSARAQES